MPRKSTPHVDSRRVTEARYESALARLLALPDSERGDGAAFGGADQTLARSRALLRELDDPHLRVPSVIVAGSKGKGSTAALIESILRAHGFATSLYTQPHLQDYRERIRLGGQLIGKPLFVDLAERVGRASSAVREKHPELGSTTTYEETTALAFLAAHSCRVDWSILEVGLGGRLDATNLGEPLVSVLTAIGLEHTAILGDTIEAIAAEKVAVFRPGRPAIVSHQDPAALTVARVHAERIGASFVLTPPLETVAAAARPIVLAAGTASTPPAGFWSVSLRGRLKSYPDLSLPLAGRFQLGNLSAAVHAVESLPDASAWIDGARVRSGVSSVHWPGRLEVASRVPLVVLDGAHTVESMRALVEAFHLHFRWQRLGVVFACFKDKPVESLLRELAQLSSLVFVTQVPHPRSMAAAEIAAVAEGLDLNAQRVEDANEAIAEAVERAGPNDAVLVTGSLSIVGQARTALSLAAE